STLATYFKTNSTEHSSKPSVQNLPKYGAGLLAVILWGSLSPYRGHSEKPPPQEVVFYCAQKNPETSERFRILTQPLDRSTDP
ncbi:hypothetical protein, partial [Shigella flexneri]